MEEVTGLTTYFSCVNQQVMKCASWGTTVDAWLRRPIRDRTSLFVAALLLIQAFIELLILASLSGGKLSSLAQVSIWIPQKVSCGEGPSTLLKATGTPSYWHTQLLSCV